MVESHLHFTEIISPQAHRAQRKDLKQDHSQKPTLRDILDKMLETQDTEEILRAARIKWHVIHRRITIRMTTDLLSGKKENEGQETMECF